jgi:lipoate-protein ligase A
MKEFRLIESGFCDARTNMAVDEAILSDYREGTSLPTLRLYGWRPAAFSIGCSQKPEEVLDLDACARGGMTYVKRPTGGGVIFHEHELTYSVILAQSDIGLKMGVKESFEKITGFLIAAYQTLGASATFAKYRGVTASRAVADFCFSRKEEYDILVQGKKIGGNAQKRKKNVILQHGSIPFTFDKNKIRRFLKNPETLNNLDIISLHEIAGDHIDFKKLSKMLIRAFGQHFGAHAKA